MTQVLIECRAVARVYEVLAARFYVKGRRLCNFSPTVLAAKWRASLVKLGLEIPMVIGYLPASNENSSCKNLTVGGLRPGAATSDYLVTQNRSRTQWRGRWMCPATLRYYLQLGTYYFTSLQFPAGSKSWIQRSRNSWHAFLDAVDT